MVLAFYAVCVGVGAAMAGVYVHELLAAEGYIPDFQTGLVVAGAAAAGYCALQFGYIALVRLLLPTRDRVPYVLDGVSNLAFLALAPYVLDIPIPMPIPALEKVAPLVYLAAAGTLHGAFKLISFFAFTSGRPGPRWPSLAWAGACAGCGLLAFNGAVVWFGKVENLRPMAPDEVNHYRAGDMVAAGRVMPEGAALAFPLTEPGRGLAVRWTFPPDSADDFEENPTAQVFFHFSGVSRDTVDKPVSLRRGAWVELRLTADEIPPGATSVQIAWTKDEEGPWQKLTGLSPVVLSNRELILSGPYRHVDRTAETAPNIVLVAIDGLGAAQTGRGKYELRISPALDRLSASLPYFPKTFAPAPEAAATCMTLLTGLSPLRHGYIAGKDGRLDESAPTLAELLRANGYATAAFTEGDGAGGRDMPYGKGWDRGFEGYDGSYWGEREDPSWYAGSQYTLDKARRWIDLHQDIQFFCFVRLRELTQFTLHDRYGTAFLPNQGEPSEADVYDAALSYLDNVLGAFVKHIRDYEMRRNTVVVLVGTHGTTFDGPGRSAATGLMDDQLRVPLVIYSPESVREGRDDLIGLEDIPAALAHVAGLETPATWSGRDFIPAPTGREPIAVAIDPLRASIRSGEWRCIWNVERTDREATLLYDHSRFYARSATMNLASRYPQQVREFQEKMRAYLDGHRALAAAN